MNDAMGRHYTSRITVIIAAVLSFFASGCATISTGYHANENAEMDRYRTFSWISDSPLVRGEADASIPISALTQSKIKNTIESELTAKGFSVQKDRSQADFLISYTIGTREKLILESYPNYYHGDWAWHVNGSRYYDRRVVQHSYTKGTLGIDIFDRKTGEPVWHGWAEKTVTSDDRQDPTSSINNGVNKLLADFPNSSE